LFCLLPDKTKVTYSRLFQMIKDLAAKHNIQSQIKRANIDFEKGAIASFQEIFQTIEVKGCQFHYGQCIWRTVQDLGFASEYRTHQEVRSWVRYAVSLAMVPLNQVDDAFIIISLLA